MHQPTFDIGRTLARQVLRLADGEQVEPALILPTELVLRQSG